MPESEPTDTVFIGATLIDGTGSPPLADSAVVVRDDRILWTGPSSALDMEAGRHLVKVDGKYLIPGLLDANVHLVFDIEPEVLLRYDPGRYDDLVVESAQVALRSGITTVFDTWGPLEALRRVRDRINAGAVTGSRIFLAGNIIGNEGPWSPDLVPSVVPSLLGSLTPGVIESVNQHWEQGVGGDLPYMPAADVRAAARDYIAGSGIDFVKYSSSAHGTKKFLAFSPEAQQAIVEEAHAAGLTVQACVMTPEATKVAIDAGVDLLQHVNSSGLYPLPADTLAHLVDRQLPCTALLRTDRNLAAVEWKTPMGRAPWGERVIVEEANARALIRAGARLLLATDGGVLRPSVQESPLFKSWVSGPDIPIRLGESHIYWFKAAIERGMTPTDALRSATSNIAQAYGKGADLGTVEAGKRADLLILNGNPLDDVENYARVAHVIKDGRPIDREKLPDRPILTAASGQSRE